MTVARRPLPAQLPDRRKYRIDEEERIKTENRPHVSSVFQRERPLMTHLPLFALVFLLQMFAVDLSVWIGFLSGRRQNRPHVPKKPAGAFMNDTRCAGHDSFKRIRTRNFFTGNRFQRCAILGLPGEERMRKGIPERAIRSARAKTHPQLRRQSSGPLNRRPQVRILPGAF